MQADDITRKTDLIREELRKVHDERVKLQETVSRLEGEVSVITLQKALLETDIRYVRSLFVEQPALGLWFQPELQYQTNKS